MAGLASSAGLYACLLPLFLGQAGIYPLSWEGCPVKSLVAGSHASSAPWRCDLDTLLPHLGPWLFNCHPFSPSFWDVEAKQGRNAPRPWQPGSGAGLSLGLGWEFPCGFHELLTFMESHPLSSESDIVYSEPGPCFLGPCAKKSRIPGRDDKPQSLPGRP